MNIWIVNHYAIPPKFGGLTRHYYFSKELGKLGDKVRIFTSGKIHNTEINFNKSKELFKVEEVDGVEYTFVKTSDYKGNGLKRIFTFLEFPWNAKKTLKQFKEEKPEIIYASSPELFSTYMAVRYAKKNNIPVVVEIRDLWPESVVEYTRLTRKNPIIIILYQLEKWIYTHADKLIFTFEGGKDYIVKKKWDKAQGGPINLTKINHVNNGVDLALNKENEKKFQVEDKDLEREDTFKVVYTGSIRKVNCVGLLIFAAKYLKEQGEKDISFIIYGDGTEKEELMRRCEEENLFNVKFKGRVDKKYIPYILSKADLQIFVGIASSMNQYGLSLNKLFDYMASGKPILSNIASGYDNIKKYQCGSVKETQSFKVLAEEILRYKNMDKKEYEQLGENGKKRAKDFDFPKLTQKLRNIFVELTEGKESQ